VVANSPCAVHLIKLPGPIDLEIEVVAQLDCLGGDEILCSSLLIADGCEVHVLRRSHSAPESVVHGQASLQHPSVRRDGEKSSQEAGEHDRLAEPNQRQSGPTAVFELARFESGPEGASRLVTHQPGWPIALSTIS
jgi:hypothetical protein